MSLNSRIKERREALSMSRIELAEKIGVTSSAIANYENAVSSPKIELMYKLFDALQCDANYLYQDEMNNLSELVVSLNEKEMITKYRELDNVGKNHVDMILSWEIERMENTTSSAPIIITAPMRSISYYQRLASAGTGQVVYGDIPVERISIPDLPEYSRVSYAIGVNGNSMEPLYYDGDMLLIEPTCEVEPGEIGIFIVGSEAFVKKLGNGELISLNADYGNIPLTSDSKCMGRVVDKISPDN